MNNKKEINKLRKDYSEVQAKVKKFVELRDDSDESPKKESNSNFTIKLIIFINTLIKNLCQIIYKIYFLAISEDDKKKKKRKEAATNLVRLNMKGGYKEKVLFNQFLIKLLETKTL